MKQKNPYINVKFVTRRAKRKKKKKNNKSLLQGKIRRVIAPVVIFEGEPPF